ncbi:MAG: peptidoglycan-binding protein [Denitrovibrio sp.]|nr:MAG: peptidoglycan-binding protein [Denitrovibrio sp.]
MTRISKLILFAALVAALVVTGCSKPPVQEMDNARAAMKAAQASGAEKCATEEYAKAKEALNAEEAKMARAESSDNKGELYEEAKAELMTAIADFEKAKEVAIERSKINDKAQAELDAYKKNLMVSANADASKYSATYKATMAKLAKAQALIDECEGMKAMAVLKQVEVDNAMIQQEIIEGKAAEMKAEAARKARIRAQMMKAQTEEYTVVKGDNLWNISKSKYMNPFMWPLIYWANKDQIKDPDLIFPKQVFKIRKYFEDDEKSKATNFAKTRGPWSLFDGK